MSIDEFDRPAVLVHEIEGATKTALDALNEATLEIDDFLTTLTREEEEEADRDFKLLIRAVRKARQQVKLVLDDYLPRLRPQLHEIDGADGIHVHDREAR